MDSPHYTENPKLYVAYQDPPEIQVEKCSITLGITMTSKALLYRCSAKKCAKLTWLLTFNSIYIIKLTG